MAMKQVLQNLPNGQIKIEDVPAPIIGPNSVLIQTQKSLISAGTERMLVEFWQGFASGQSKIAARQGQACP
jgi:threonine dehydrogenase-like Zn-dependent dehydrogenase